MKAYCLGFCYDEEKKKTVLLINKTKPSWQYGKLNGIGGSVEANETPLDAMLREFKEEADLFCTNWQNKIIMFEHDMSWCVYIFFGSMPLEQLGKYRSLTEEQVTLQDVHLLPDTVIPNLHWIIPMLKDNLVQPIVVHYKRNTL